VTDVARKTSKAKKKPKKNAQELNKELVREAKRKLKGGDTIRNIVLYCTSCKRKSIDCINNEHNRFIYRHEEHAKLFKENYRCNLCFPFQAKNGKMVYKMAQLIEALGVHPWWIKKENKDVRDIKNAKTSK